VRRLFAKLAGRGGRLVLTASLALLALGQTAGWSPARAAAPEVIVLTDIGQDPDDTQSLIRMLLYSNELSIKGILPTYIPKGPVRPDLVNAVLDAYGKDLGRLRQHDPNFPTAALLKNRVKPGLNLNNKVGKGYDSAAAQHIVYMVDQSQGPIWVLVWGGIRELAQAIYNVKSTRSEAAFIAFQRKLRVYSISLSQYSPEPGQYLMDNAKEMFWIASIEHDGSKTATFRGMYLLGDQSMQNETWLKANILNRGNLGRMYPLNTTEKGLKEGDSPSFLHILPIGLSDPELPKGGGWGGRYTKEAEYYKISKNLYTSKGLLDEVNGVKSRRMAVARWRPAYQADFAARVRWLETNYAQANHPPVAKLASAANVTVKPGGKVTLDASKSSDPDGDGLSYRWWIYKEVSNYYDSVKIDNANSAKATLTAPGTALSTPLNVILEVTDNGSPRLTRYQRVLVNVQN